MRIPKYRLHKATGKGIVTFNGQDFYLGIHGSIESHKIYQDLCKQYLESNGKTPVIAPVVFTSLSSLIEQWKRYAEPIINDRDFERTVVAFDIAAATYGSVAVDSFGPKSLKNVRSDFEQTGNTRQYINRQVRCIISVFKWGVSEELVLPATLQALQSISPLKQRETKAPEAVKRQPVPIDHVRATLECMLPIPADMLRLQVLTGMRPGELCRIRPVDIEQMHDAWIYRPARHKTKSRGKSRAIPIVGLGIDVLKSYMDRPGESYCFSPQESLQQLRAERTSKRATPKSCGNRVGTNRKARPKRKPGVRYTPSSYRHAVQRAAKAAKVPHWTPYQARHTAGTMARQKQGIEAAQALLGHSKIDMTERYAEVQLSRAIEAANSLDGSMLDFKNCQS